MPVLTAAGDGWSQPASSEIEPAGASRYPLVGCPRASTASAVMISVQRVQSRQFRALVAEEERQGSTAVTLMQLLEVESLMSACSSTAHFAKDAMPARRRPPAQLRPPQLPKGATASVHQRLLHLLPQVRPPGVLLCGLLERVLLVPRWRHSRVLLALPARVPSLLTARIGPGDPWRAPLRAQGRALRVRDECPRGPEVAC
jgi:hypothetical protein